MNLTEYLFERIRELGVGHTFGIPGDFVFARLLPFKNGLACRRWVCAHEPGVGFAADAYARIKGLGVAPRDLRAGRPSIRSIPSRALTLSSLRCSS